jgi:hypothetical protein
MTTLHHRARRLSIQKGYEPHCVYLRRARQFEVTMEFETGFTPILKNLNNLKLTNFYRRFGV